MAFQNYLFIKVFLWQSHYEPSNINHYQLGKLSKLTLSERKYHTVRQKSVKNRPKIGQKLLAGWIIWKDYDLNLNSRVINRNYDLYFWSYFIIDSRNYKVLRLSRLIWSFKRYSEGFWSLYSTSTPFEGLLKSPEDLPKIPEDPWSSTKIRTRENWSLKIFEEFEDFEDFSKCQV